MARTKNAFGLSPPATQQAHSRPFGRALDADGHAVVELVVVVLRAAGEVLSFGRNEREVGDFFHLPDPGRGFLGRFRFRFHQRDPGSLRWHEQGQFLEPQHIPWIKRLPPCEDAIDLAREKLELRCLDLCEALREKRGALVRRMRFAERQHENLAGLHALDLTALDAGPEEAPSQQEPGRFGQRVIAVGEEFDPRLQHRIARGRRIRVLRKQGFRERGDRESAEEEKFHGGGFGVTFCPGGTDHAISASQSG